MTTPMEIAKKYEAALFAGRMDEVASYFTADAKYWVAGPPSLGGTWTGPAAIVRAFEKREPGLGAADWGYEDVWRDSQKGPKLDGLNKKTAEAFSLMIESIQALIRENKDVLWGSMIKQTMQRKKPSFNEGYYGYSTFSELLEDAERKNIIKLKKDQRSGTYIVTGFAKTGDGATAAGRR